MITNPAGQVALKNYPPHQVMVQNTPTKSGYLFRIQADIALAWVDPADVDNILARKPKGCCPGSRKYTFSYASEDDIRRWTNNGGR